MFPVTVTRVQFLKNGKVRITADPREFDEQNINTILVFHPETNSWWAELDTENSEVDIDLTGIATTV